jgi:hypothetical protein
MVVRPAAARNHPGYSALRKDQCCTLPSLQFLLDICGYHADFRYNSL